MATRLHSTRFKVDLIRLLRRRESLRAAQILGQNFQPNSAPMSRFNGSSGIGPLDLGARFGAATVLSPYQTRALQRRLRRRGPALRLTHRAHRLCHWLMGPRLTTLFAFSSLTTGGARSGQDRIKRRPIALPRGQGSGESAPWWRHTRVLARGHAAQGESRCVSQTGSYVTRVTGIAR